MLLSVIIPVYNSAPYLRRCVESVIRQTYRDMEIILVDDGSTDESGAICDEYARMRELESERVRELGNERIRVIHKPNGGSSTARNAGIEIAKGDYVVFLDSDDEWLIEDGIEQMMLRMRQKRADVLLFKLVDIYMEKYYYRKDYDDLYTSTHTSQEVFNRMVQLEQFPTGACRQIVSRELLRDNGILFPIDMISGEDTHFMCLVWQKACVAGVINLEMYGCHHRDNSVSASYSIRNLLSYDKLFSFWEVQIKNHCISYQTIGALMANLFVSGTYNYFSIAYKDRTQAKQVLLNHQDLLSYAASKKSLRMKKVVDQLGISAGIFIFATYGRMKKIYIALRQSLVK